MAQGTDVDVDVLVNWLWTGSSLALVTGVESDVVAIDSTLKDFFIHPNPEE
jgi:hypothetical protein